VVKYLKYPAANFKNIRYTRQIRTGITALIFVMIIPSFYLAYRLWNEKAYTKIVESFINTELANNGYMVIYKKINYNSNPRKVELALLNKNLDSMQINAYNRILSNMGATNTELTFRQNDDNLKAEILNEINYTEHAISEKDLAINRLRTELDKYKLQDSTVTKELLILFPTLNNIALGKIEQYANTDSAQMLSVLLYRSSEDIDQIKLSAWLKERLKTPNVMLFRR
jgi:hypothetical protein